MATSRTVSLPLPSSRRGLGWQGERIQRFLLHDRTLGYLFLLPALLVIVGLVAYPFASAIVMTFHRVLVESWDAEEGGRRGAQEGRGDLCAVSGGVGGRARRAGGGQLVLDDFGLKPLRPPGPEDFYDAINERYEKASILLTSNCARAEWPELFGEPLLAPRLILTHGAHFVEMTAPSFRAEHTKKQVATRCARAATT